MGSLVVHLDLNLMTEEHGELDWRKNTSIAPAIVYKAAVGYNSATWGVNATVNGNNYWAKGVSTQKYAIMGGFLRFSVSKKIDTYKKRKAAAQHA